MNDDPLAQLPLAITKEQASGWSAEERGYLTDCVNHINHVLASPKGTSTITEIALRQATGKDLLSPKVRKALVEHYRKAGWTVDVDDADHGTRLIFS